MTLRGRCAGCQVEIALYKKYPSGKLNKDAFKYCLGCHKKQRKPEVEKENTGASNTNSSEAGAVMSFLCGVEMSGDGINTTANASDQVIEDEHIFVTVSISSEAHSKFQRCKSDRVFSSISTTATFGVIGAGMLSKLQGEKSMIVRGRLVVKIMSAGTFVEKAVLVDNNIQGLHLDQETMNKLSDQSCSQICANKGGITLGHHIFTPDGWSRVSSFQHPQLRV